MGGDGPVEFRGRGESRKIATSPLAHIFDQNRKLNQIRRELDKIILRYTDRNDLFKLVVSTVYTHT